MEPCDIVRAEVSKYDWDIETAMAVAKAESNCRQEALGDTSLVYVQNGREYGYSKGVFQIRILPGREHCDTYDLAMNVACAYRIYSYNSTFSPWSAYVNGSYLAFL